MTNEHYIEMLIADRKLMLEACKEYRETIDRLERELKAARECIEDVAIGGGE